MTNWNLKPDNSNHKLKSPSFVVSCWQLLDFPEVISYRSKRFRFNHKVPENGIYLVVEVNMLGQKRIVHFESVVVTELHYILLLFAELSFPTWKNWANLVFAHQNVVVNIASDWALILRVGLEKLASSMKLNRVGNSAHDTIHDAFEHPIFSTGSTIRRRVEIQWFRELSALDTWKSVFFTCDAVLQTGEATFLSFFLPIKTQKTNLLSRGLLSPTMAD